jgi:arsenate reductase-like glutaredoxin family protein
VYYSRLLVPAEKEEMFSMDSSEHVGNSFEGSREARKLVVYTSEGCTRCRMLKKWMKNMNVEFEEKDIGNAEVMADLIMRDTYILSSPALEVRGAVYREDEIFYADGIAEDRLLKILDGEINGRK